MSHATHFSIAGRRVGADEPAYFIADVASNHDGDLERAKALIWLSKEAGADAVKFQHFLAERIVSAQGFRSLGGQLSHQAKWSKPVHEVYRQYELDRDWTGELVAEARRAGITFMTTPYDPAAVELVGRHVPAWKIGSGDITWTPFLELIARQGKPVLIATGAADMTDSVRAVETLLAHNPEVCVMQCNTNYTGSVENFRYVNLRVLGTFARQWPGMPLGLSDHTPGHAAVLGAIALGARVVEKHFTDDTSREGPDHPFSMDPRTWREMVDRSRELELALGDGVKRVEPNEQDTIVVQRRCVRAARDLRAGTVVTEADVEALRPAPAGSVEPWQEVVGRVLTADKAAGDALFESDLDGHAAG